MKFKYYAVNKPYGVLSQFSDKEERKTLAGLYNFPKDVYPVGRLDMDSEGLLLLTNDKRLTDYLLSAKFSHEREYYVQVEGIPTDEDLQKLGSGLIIEERPTLSCKVTRIDSPEFPPRVPPVRERKSIPDCWISMVLTEGRNRQVRKMTAKIGYPTLRLVRVRIKNILLNNLPAGGVRELNSNELKDIYKRQ